MNNLYDYVFHFNTYEEAWYAIPRDKYNEYWDNKNAHGLLKSKDINILISVISKNIKP